MKKYLKLFVVAALIVPCVMLFAACKGSEVKYHSITYQDLGALGISYISPQELVANSADVQITVRLWHTYDQSEITLYANGQMLTLENADEDDLEFKCVISNVTEDQIVTIDGLEKNSDVVVLTRAYKTNLIQTENYTAPANFGTSVGILWEFNILGDVDSYYDDGYVFECNIGATVRVTFQTSLHYASASLQLNANEGEIEISKSVWPWNHERLHWITIPSDYIVTGDTIFCIDGLYY